MNSTLPTPSGESRAEQDRRSFLRTCGRFAAVTPPAVTLLLSTSLNSGAIAKSGGGGPQGNNGYGNGGDDGVPGHSGFEDTDR